MVRTIEAVVRPMQYPLHPGSASETPFNSAADNPVRLRELERRLAEQGKQFACELESARQGAFEDGREDALAEQRLWRQQAGAQLAAAVEEFRLRRDDYLARVEHEVVRLALSIAERVIRREAQMDPLLLAGAVRVALGQLSDAGEVSLRVPAAQEEMWAEMVRVIPGLPVRPRVVADPELQPVEAVLEASVGTVDLGVRAQLGEIERGFFDLLEARETTAPQPSQPRVEQPPFRR